MLISSLWSAQTEQVWTDGISIAEVSVLDLSNWIAAKCDFMKNLPISQETQRSQNQYIESNYEDNSSKRLFKNIN